METGHHKNVANFENVTIILGSLGRAYAPTQPLITNTALQTKLTAARDALAVAALGNAHDARDAVLYDGETGIIKLVKLIKTYLAVNPGKVSAALPANKCAGVGRIDRNL